MSRVIFLDSGPLGFALTPTHSQEHLECSQWLEARIAGGDQVVIPEIVDYECRRGGLRHDNTAALMSLDQAKADLTYVPITTEAMLRASRFWADSRKGGYATTDDVRLDADVILAGQVVTFSPGTSDVIVATLNVRHLSRFVPAKNWREIT
jgi:predicted nucleic acid-binding protein